MRAKYYQDDDLLVIRITNKPFVAAQKLGSFLVHYDKNRKPVSVEILNASKLLRESSKALPNSVRQTIFAPSNP